MPDVLFIKTSSLGDVVHHMPALTEAKANNPQTRFGWVVEEAYAPLVALHPAVDWTIPVAGRRWRSVLSKGATWGEIARFLGRLRERRYDAVIDTQGLFFKSGLVARGARGRRLGYDPNSIKEPWACVFYNKVHAVSRNQHAVTRNRALTAAALGYSLDGEPDFGLDREALARVARPRYAVLLHATAREDKQWPEANWRMLAAALGTEIDVVLTHGNDAEEERAVRLASATERARVAERAPLDEMARLIAGASLVIGVDTGLLHLAAALGVPLVAIFAATEPGLTGPVGSGPIEIVGGLGTPPSVGDVLDAVNLVKSQGSASD